MRKLAYCTEVSSFRPHLAAPCLSRTLWPPGGRGKIFSSAPRCGQFGISLKFSVGVLVPFKSSGFPISGIVVIVLFLSEDAFVCSICGAPLVRDVTSIVEASTLCGVELQGVWTQTLSSQVVVSVCRKNRVRAALCEGLSTILLHCRALWCVR